MESESVVMSLLTSICLRKRIVCWICAISGVVIQQNMVCGMIIISGQEIERPSSRHEDTSINKAGFRISTCTTTYAL